MCPYSEAKARCTLIPLRRLSVFLQRPASPFPFLPFLHCVNGCPHPHSDVEIKIRKFLISEAHVIGDQRTVLMNTVSICRKATHGGSSVLNSAWERMGQQWRQEGGLPAQWRCCLHLGLPVSRSVNTLSLLSRSHSVIDFAMRGQRAKAIFRRCTNTLLIL